MGQIQQNYMGGDAFKGKLVVEQPVPGLPSPASDLEADRENERNKYDAEVHLASVTVSRQALDRCYYEKGVNHLEHCRKEQLDYLKMLSQLPQAQFKYTWEEKPLA